MDRLPKPDQLVAAAGNLAHKLLHGGVADLRPMPRTLIDEGELREVYHYRPMTAAGTHGEPVLLVAPLAAPALCYDLRRDCSLVEHLAGGGRPTYLVEYGEVAFRDRTLGIEHWVEEVVPAAVAAVADHAGGRPVHVVGWSLGGIFALLAAADRTDLPIASLTVLGAPVDVSQVPLVAPLRPWLDLTDGRLLGLVYQLMGGAPRPLVWAFQRSSFQKLVAKRLAVAAQFDDADFLAQVEAVDRFTANMVAYHGRSFGQLYHRFVRTNLLTTGRYELADRTVDLAAVEVPVLVFAGATDGIAPVNAVKAVVPLLTGALEVRFEIVAGGHLGLLTGRAARGTTWRALEEWLDQWSTRAKKRPTRSPAGKRAAKTSTTKMAAGTRTATKKTATTKAATRKTATKKTATATPPAEQAGPPPSTPPSSDAIGTNPTRRYGSAGSRTLAR